MRRATGVLLAVAWPCFCYVAFAVGSLVLHYGGGEEMVRRFVLAALQTTLICTPSLLFLAHAFEYRSEVQLVADLAVLAPLFVPLFTQTCTPAMLWAGGVPQNLAALNERMFAVLACTMWNLLQWALAATPFMLLPAAWRRCCRQE